MITVNMPEITPKITPSVIGSKYFSVVPEYATTPAKFESLVYPIVSPNCLVALGDISAEVKINGKTIIDIVAVNIGRVKNKPKSKWTKVCSRFGARSKQGRGVYTNPNGRPCDAMR